MKINRKLANIVAGVFLAVVFIWMAIIYVPQILSSDLFKSDVVYSNPQEMITKSKPGDTVKFTASIDFLSFNSSQTERYFIWDKVPPNKASGVVVIFPVNGSLQPTASGLATYKVKVRNTSGPYLYVDVVEVNKA